MSVPSKKEIDNWFKAHDLKGKKAQGVNAVRDAAKSYAEAMAAAGEMETNPVTMSRDRDGASSVATVWKAYESFRDAITTNVPDCEERVVALREAERTFNEFRRGSVVREVVWMVRVTTMAANVGIACND